MQSQVQYPSAKTIKLLLSQIETAFVNEDSDKLSKLLKSVYLEPAYNTSADRWKITISTNNYQNTIHGQGFCKLLELIKSFQIEKIKKGINFAFKIHLDILGHLLKMLDDIKDQQSLWLCKPLRQIIRASKKIFFAANKRELETGGALKVKKDDLIRKLQQFIARKTLLQEIKRQIIPLINNMQVSIMLVYHNYGQITTIFKNTKQYGEHGPQFVDNYYFQRAKTHLIYEQFQEAEQYFQKISIKTHGQKRLVLKYLIPCKMFLGKTFLPNPDNPEQHFPEYQSIAKALTKAKFNDYSQAIKKYQKLWIKRGIYLLMDKLRIILWRNLLKKVQKILGEYKIDINKVHKAVLLSGGDQKLEECICIISNLIYEGKVKGYIFQNEDQRVLVLKKDGDGFPSLAK